MIDFDQFWAEPGCLPGISKEQSEAYLRQLVDQYGPGAAAFDPSVDSMLHPGPGLTTEQIAAWESEHGVQLPEVLRQAFARQNGGFVYDTHLRILPLEEIANPDDEFWDWASYEEEEIPDRTLVFRFAEDQQVDGELYLNFNLQGPQEEPAVMTFHSDPGELHRQSKSVTKFLTRMLETFEVPAVDWSETERLEIVARETVDRSEMHNAPAQLEQVLARQDGSLLLFSREHSPSGETLTRTTLPEPLSKDMARIDRHPATFALMLYPEESDGIVQLESKQMRSGRWKNQTMKGAPVYVEFESAERSRVDALRKTLHGDKAASHAEAQEARQDAFQQTMGDLSPEQRQAAMMQVMLKQMDQMREQHGSPFEGLFSSPSVPPEAAQLHELMQQRLREIEARARETIAKNPTDPHILRMMEDMMTPKESEPDAEEE
jgi:hypothetical protein